MNRDAAMGQRAARSRARTLVTALAALLLPFSSGCSSTPQSGAASPTGGAGSSNGSEAGSPDNPAGASTGGSGGSDVNHPQGGAGGVSEGGNVAASGSAGMASGGGVGGDTPMIAAGVRWVGRVDVSDPAAVKFAWSGSGFIGHFTGPTVSAKLKTVGDGDIFFRPVVDGTPGKRFSVNASETVVDVATGLAAGTHQVELYRENEGKGLGYSVFLGFTQGTAAAPPPASGRLIEVIGDSISAGYGNLGNEQHPNYGPDPNGGCRFTTETESAYQAYGAVAARAVNADVSVLAGSGWGIYSDNGGNTQNVMPALFGNTVGEQKMPAWGFVSKPQAVVVNLGTNDSSAHNLTADKFKPAYSAFLTTIRSKYPDALILCAVGTMMSGPDRDNAVIYLEDIIAERTERGDTKLKLLDLGTQDAAAGTGCDWHPNVAEDQRMAALLTAELKASLAW